MASWDNFYALEKDNFESNPDDTGECWFSDSNAEEKMVEFLFDNLNEYAIHDQSSMVDIGTGNGHLLFTLREEGFKGQLLGIDYSEKSVEFARSIAEENDVDVEFEVVDIFSESWDPKVVDVVLDKGTLDAIALSGLQYNGKPVVEIYPHAIDKLMTKGSVFLITSCNFTEKELESIILQNKSLKLWKKVDYPSFQFGGVKGSTICTLAFVKQS